MRSPAQALLWELWRLSRLELGVRVAAQTLLLSPMFYLIGADNRAREFLAGPVFMLMVGTSLFSSMWINSFDNRRQGFSFYLCFSRPIGTPLLVALPMLYITSASAICYLVPACLLRWSFGVPLPLLSAAAVIGTACAGFIMSVWSTQSFSGRMVNFMGMAIVSGLAAIMWTNHHGALETLLVSPEAWPEIFAFSLVHYTVLLILFAVFVAVTTIAVHRQRHGDRLEWDGLIRRAHPSLRHVPWPERPFRTPWHAQCWYEMRRSGVHVLLSATAASLAAFAFVSLCHHFGELAGKGLGLWCFALATCPLVYAVMGAEWVLGLKRKQGNTYLSSFDATQAAGSGRLMAVKLAAISASAGLGWLMMLLAALLWCAVWGGFADVFGIAARLSPLIAEVPARWWGFAALSIAVFYVTGTLLLLSGTLYSVLHPRIFLVGVFLAAGHVLLALWDSKHGPVLGPLWTAEAWLYAAGISAGTAWVWRRALARGHADKTHLAMALCPWAALTASTVAGYYRLMPKGLPIPPQAPVLAYAMLLLPLAAVAVAPLSLAAHRHR